MTAKVMQGCAFDLLPTLRAGSVDVCVTSPPYWMLRSYLPRGHPLKAKELGSERTPAEYVARVVELFRLVREALAPHGTVWLNIGDTYCNAGSRNNGTGLDGKRRGGMEDTEGDWEKVKESFVDIRHSIGLEVGSLCLIPQRLAISLQDDGWLVRSVICWHKPAPMPVSLAGWRWCRCRVKERSNINGIDVPNLVSPPMAYNGRGENRDGVKAAQWADCPGCKKCEPAGGYVLRRGSWRPTSSYEPVLMLAKSPGYFSDGEAVRKIAEADDANLAAQGFLFPEMETADPGGGAGANLRDVWTIAAEPLKEKHYASFPSELVYRCLKAGTSAKGYCPSCGGPWARVVETTPVGSYHDHGGDGVEYGLAQTGGRPRALDGRPSEANAPAYRPPKTLGWRPSCSCIGADTFTPRPGVVLDPFAGSGRTGLQARRLGLDFVGCELNEEYARMAERLLYEDSPLFG